MKTVYIVGSGFESVEHAKLVAGLKGKEVEVVLLNSIEDAPMSARLSSDPSVVREVFKIEAIPEDLRVTTIFKEKHKGHESPYKYHR